MMQDVHLKVNPGLPSGIQQEGFFQQQIGLTFKEKVVKCYIWSIALYGAETGKLQGVDQKYVENFWSVVLEKVGEVGLIV